MLISLTMTIVTLLLLTTPIKIFFFWLLIFTHNFHSDLLSVEYRQPRSSLGTLVRSTYAHFTVLFVKLLKAIHSFKMWFLLLRYDESACIH